MAGSHRSRGLPRAITDGRALSSGRRPPCGGKGCKTSMIGTKNTAPARQNGVLESLVLAHRAPNGPSEPQSGVLSQGLPSLVGCMHGDGRGRALRALTSRRLPPPAASPGTPTARADAPPPHRTPRSTRRARAGRDRTRTPQLRRAAHGRPCMRPVLVVGQICQNVCQFWSCLWPRPYP